MKKWFGVVLALLCMVVCSRTSFSATEEEKPGKKDVSSEAKKSVSEKGLIAYWNFNEGAGVIAKDSSGNGNEGTLEKMEPSRCWVDGKAGKALQFKGTNGYVQTPVMIGSLDEKTITGWFNFDDPAKTWQRMVLEGTAFDSSQYCGLVVSKNSIYLYQSINDGKSALATGGNVQLTGGQWYFVAGVIDKKNSSITLYINGDLVYKYENAKISSAEFNCPVGNIKIGGGSGALGFVGIIDEVRIYNQALSAEEIKTLYGQQSVGVNQ